MPKLPVSPYLHHSKAKDDIHQVDPLVVVDISFRYGGKTRFLRRWSKMSFP